MFFICITNVLSNAFGTDIWSGFRTSFFKLITTTLVSCVSDMLRSFWFQSIAKKDRQINWNKKQFCEKQCVVLVELLKWSLVAFMFNYGYTFSFSLKCVIFSKVILQRNKKTFARIKLKRKTRGRKRSVSTIFKWKTFHEHR